MKKIIYLSAILLVSLGVTQKTIAQEKEKILAEGDEKKMFDKKFMWGLSWNQYWGTIEGENLPKEYFTKPCIGGGVRAEYYPLSFIGVGVGVGIQQRGAGIINVDNYGGSFTHPWEPNPDLDSTYLERLRFNTIEIPVSLLLRTPKEVIKGVKLSGAAGLVFINNTSVIDFFNKPDDGFHTSTDVTKDYISSDLGYQMSFGADIVAAQSCILQVHLVYSKGTKNIYKTGAGNGQVETYGFRVSWLFN
jgi:hypothetical protein